MPEGDTIHKIAAAMAPRLVGQRLCAARVHQRRQQQVSGVAVTAVEAHGKHLLIELDDGYVLRSHLGMHGSWHRYLPGERWRRPQRQASLVLQTERDVFVCFNAMEVEWLRAAGVRRRVFGQRLGQDLLRSEPDLAQVTDRARELLDGDTPIAQVLLDQRVAAGIGNVYKCELLFIERLAPATPLSQVTDETLRRLYGEASRLLRGNLGGGRRVTRREGDQAGRLWVYGRAGKPCLRCETPVACCRVGEPPRTTWYCPSCQQG